MLEGRVALMTNTVRRASLIALGVIVTACRDVALPTAATSIPPPSIPPTSANPSPIGTPPAFPSVSRSARVYVGVDSPYYPMHGSPLASRYVLYDDGTFALQYASANYPFFEYRGTYEEANDLITFVGGESWIGTIIGDSLAVRYTEMMHHSDFLDGVYVRSR
jgi:hypothetical protein